MQAKITITGELIPLSQNVIGVLSALNELEGELFSSEKITGVISTTNTILGDIVIPPERPIDPYMGEYEVQSKPFEDEVLRTKNHSMTKNLTVLKIPYYETSNETGYTIYIGGE